MPSLHVSNSDGLEHHQMDIHEWVFFYSFLMLVVLLWMLLSRIIDYKGQCCKNLDQMKVQPAKNSFNLLTCKIEVS